MKQNEIQDISVLLDQNLLDSIRTSFSANVREKDVLSHREFSDLFIQLNIFNSITLHFLITKIDLNRKGFMLWDDFTTFLISHFYNDVSSIYLNRLVLFVSSAKSKLIYGNICYSPPISAGNIPHYIIACSGCTLSFFNPDTLICEKSLYYKDKLSVHRSQMESLPTSDKAMILKHSCKMFDTLEETVITSICIIPISCHICIATSDARLSVYESYFNNDLVAIYSDMNIAATKVYAYVHIETNIINDIEQNEQFRRVIYGDSTGMVKILDFDLTFSHTIFKEIKNMKCLATLHHHTDSITCFAYIESFFAIIISSNDGTISFINPSTYKILRTFNAHISLKTRTKSSMNTVKNSVNSVKCSKSVEMFCCSEEMKWICASISKNIVFIDPFTLDILHILNTLTSSTIGMYVNDSLKHIIISTNNKKNYIYDTMSYTLLQNITDRNIYKPNILYTSLYVYSLKKYYTCSNKISGWNIEIVSEYEAQEQLRIHSEKCYEEVSSRNEIIATFLACSERVVIVERTGNIRTYDFFTGELIGYFDISVKLKESRYWLVNVEGMKQETSLEVIYLTNAVIDTSEKRVIVTTQDNMISIWNYLDGECLQAVCPILSECSQLTSIHSLLYAELISGTNVIRCLFLSFYPRSEVNTIQCHYDLGR